MASIFDLRPNRDCGDESLLSLRVPPDPRYGRLVRERVVTYAAGQGVGADALSGLLSAIGEALANAIEHSGCDSAIEIGVRVDAGKIVATIVDAGRGLCEQIPRRAPFPEGLAERGRGIPIMQHYTDIFAVYTVAGRGTVIELGCYLAPLASEGSAAAG
ncbi:MAG: ATP-binding protein [Vulcanimicrobiaceae bacterium]